MKINNKIFNYPPYISTSWNNVSSLHMKGSLLIVTLKEGEVITIPGLQSQTIELIFATHAAFLEQDLPKEMELHKQKSAPQSMLFHQELMAGADSPFRLGFASMDELGSVLQHNPAQKNAPDLPREVLQKISAITKIVAPNEALEMPKPEPHCNCMHCQIARAISQDISFDEPIAIESQEEDVSEADLTFCQWEIAQSTPQMFTVTNRIDPIEKYNVYLGNPVGCTCGKEGCEHIVAVLKS